MHWQIDKKLSGISRDCIGLTVILAVTLGARLFSFYGDPLIPRDGIYYLYLAENWQNLQPGDATKPLFYIYLLVKLHQLGLSFYSAGVALSFVASCVIPFIGYFAVRFFSRSRVIALATGLLIGLHPGYVNLSCQILRDGLFLALFAMTLGGCAYAIVKPASFLWCMLGIGSALCCLCRWEGLLLPCGVLVYWGSEFLWHRQECSFRNLMRICGIYLLSFLVSFYVVGQVSQSYSMYIPQVKECLF